MEYVVLAAKRTDLPVHSAHAFIKFAGAKNKLLPELLSRVPSPFRRYHEPFVGGGALFWALADAGRLQKSPVLGDTNALLVRTYQSIQRDVSCVIKRLEGMPNSEDDYYRIRDEDPSTMTDSDAAAWFLYMNKLCFNGLFRVNKQGRFNVPYAKCPRRKVFDELNLRACARVLRETCAVIRCASFESVLADVELGDFLYMDPPYEPVSKTSNFTSYTTEGFKLADQERLRDCVYALKRRGVHVLLSNSTAPQVRDLYEGRGFNIEVVLAPRSINSKGDRRGDVEELLIS